MKGDALDQMKTSKTIEACADHIVAFARESLPYELTARWDIDHEKRWREQLRDYLVHVFETFEQAVSS